MRKECEKCGRTRELKRLGGQGPRLCSACYERQRRAGECPTVEVGLLAEAMSRYGMRSRDVALRLGWLCHGRYPDGGRVNRYLGLRPDGDGRSRARLHYDTAVVIARAINPDLVLELDL